MTGRPWRVELGRRADKDLGRLDPPVVVLRILPRGRAYDR